MNILSKNSRGYLVNSFADFIISKIPTKELSIIQVVDCENFYVVKGKTTYKEILDLNKVKDEFFEKNPDLKNEKKLLNTIDIIDYGSKIVETEKYKNIFFNSNNCFYSKNILDTPLELIYTSSFPFGYSLDMGRLLYYYAKKLIYNIPPAFLYDEIILEIKRENNILVLKFHDIHGNPIQELDSVFLDCVDFNLEKFKKEVLENNWLEELEFQENDLEFLKKPIEGIIYI